VPPLQSHLAAFSNSTGGPGTNNNNNNDDNAAAAAAAAAARMMMAAVGHSSAACAESAATSGGSVGGSVDGSVGGSVVSPVPSGLSLGATPVAVGPLSSICNVLIKGGAWRVSVTRAVAACAGAMGRGDIFVAPLRAAITAADLLSRADVGQQQLAAECAVGGGGSNLSSQQSVSSSQVTARITAVMVSRSSGYGYGVVLARLVALRMGDGAVPAVKKKKKLVLVGGVFAIAVI
jgi:hypothetical protein